METLTVRAAAFVMSWKWRLLVFAAVFLLQTGGDAASLELSGVTAIPHIQSEAMRYRNPPEPGLGARVQLFLRNVSGRSLRIHPNLDLRFRGRTPDHLLRASEWTWHDTPSAWTSNELSLPPDALTVWSFNSRGTNWGVGTDAGIEVQFPDAEPDHLRVSITMPRVWLSAVTFLGTTNGIAPDVALVHVVNESDGPLVLRGFRLWLPATRSQWRALTPMPWILLTHTQRFPSDGVIPPHDRGGVRVITGPLPLNYAAVEIQVDDGSGRTQSLWAHLRIKPETFDISGGWVAEGLGGSNTLHNEIYLKTLRRMHVNAGMHQEVPGYTDNPTLYDRYPLKYMNRCEPLDRYDTDTVLPRIHAVEFLGEPQFGGGRPVPPMEVWRALAPYQASRLPTSVTHSEERIWRWYAGLSDYPHYDAYRVTAPAPDFWGQYDRWGGARIRWGAPLETIGDMTRSLRELNRPMPVAYWSQGAHYDWGRYGGRQRTSPTPDELRLQAYHALASRITSLYWFNLSLKSLLRFRDLIDPITRVDREILLMAPFLLEGDAFRYRRTNRADGRLDWDLASVCGPRAALLFALDLDYTPDPAEKVFRFGPPRHAEWRFELPSYLQQSTDVFRLDADGVQDVRWTRDGNGLVLTDHVSRVAVYLATPDPGLRATLEARRLSFVRQEADLQFNPAGSDADFQALLQLLGADRR